jgi:hypothetical protein
MLRRTLPTWLDQTQPFDEIVIVQWGGNENPQDVMPDDERIVFVEVEGTSRWILSHAYNLGMTLSTGEVIYKMDTDYLLKPDFAETYSIPFLSTSFFWTGNWEMFPESQMNKRNINGCVVLPRLAFDQANGYNERIIEYGYDDDDFYQRLIKLGWQRRNIEYGPIEHIPHGDAIRACGTKPGHRGKLIDANFASCNNQPWSIRDRRIPWKLYKKTPRHFVCKRRGT